MAISRASPGGSRAFKTFSNVTVLMTVMTEVMRTCSGPDVLNYVQIAAQVYTPN
jgi:hypothetical protein